MNVEYVIDEITVDEALLRSVDRAGLAREIQLALESRPSIVEGISAATWVPRFAYSAAKRESASMGDTVAVAVTNALGGGQNPRGTD